MAFIDDYLKKHSDSLLYRMKDDDDYLGYIETAKNQDKHEKEIDKKAEQDMEGKIALKCPRCKHFCYVDYHDDVYRCPICLNFMREVE